MPWQSAQPQKHELQAALNLKVFNQQIVTNFQAMAIAAMPIRNFSTQLWSSKPCLRVVELSFAMFATRKLSESTAPKSVRTQVGEYAFIRTFAISLRVAFRHVNGRACPTWGWVIERTTIQCATIGCPGEISLVRMPEGCS